MATTIERGDADRATTTDPSTPDGRAHSSTIGTARRRLTGIRGRIVVGYAVLMATALTVAIVIARQVHVARVERTIEIELVEESDKLRQLADDVAPNTDRDVRDLFDAFLASNVASDNEAFYTIPFDSASPGDGIRYSFGAPTRLLDDDELIGRLSSVRAPTMSAYDTPDGNIGTGLTPEEPRMGHCGAVGQGMNLLRKLGRFVGVQRVRRRGQRRLDDGRRRQGARVLYAHLGGQPALPAQRPHTRTRGRVTERWSTRTTSATTSRPPAPWRGSGHVPSSLRTG